MGFLGWLTGTDKYGHAQSALIAKYTYEQLSEDNKFLVEKTACMLLQAGGYPMDKPSFSTSGLRPDDRCCLYAMSMASIGIEPALKGVCITTTGIL